VAKAKPTAGKVPTGQLLSRFLRQLATEVETISENGTPVTKAQVLAELVWKTALGYEKADPDDPNKKKYQPPAQWAIQMIYDRLEGRIPEALQDTKGGTIAEKVTELGRKQVNELAEVKPIEAQATEQ
jgi:hypothetical protein